MGQDGIRGVTALGSCPGPALTKADAVAKAPPLKDYRVVGYTKPKERAGNRAIAKMLSEDRSQLLAANDPPILSLNGDLDGPTSVVVGHDPDDSEADNPGERVGS